MSLSGVNIKQFAKQLFICLSGVNIAVGSKNTTLCDIFPASQGVTMKGLLVTIIACLKSYTDSQVEEVYTKRQI